MDGQNMEKEKTRTKKMKGIKLVTPAAMSRLRYSLIKKQCI